jgi:hypothetical protein
MGSGSVRALRSIPAKSRELLSLIEGLNVGFNFKYSCGKCSPKTLRTISPKTLGHRSMIPFSSKYSCEKVPQDVEGDFPQDVMPQERDMNWCAKVDERRSQGKNISKVPTLTYARQVWAKHYH